MMGSFPTPSLGLSVPMFFWASRGNRWISKVFTGRFIVVVVAYEEEKQ